MFFFVYHLVHNGISANIIGIHFIFQKKDVIGNAVIVKPKDIIVMAIMFRKTNRILINKRFFEYFIPQHNIDINVLIQKKAPFSRRIVIFPVYAAFVRFLITFIFISKSIMRADDINFLFFQRFIQNSVAAGKIPVITVAKTDIFSRCILQAAVARCSGTKIFRQGYDFNIWVTSGISGQDFSAFVR